MGDRQLSDARSRGRRQTSFALALATATTFATAGISAAEPFDLAQMVVPPGEFVSLDTHRIYYRCIGAGTPTVVVDNGIGGAAIEWTPLQEALAPTTRVYLRSCGLRLERYRAGAAHHRTCGDGIAPSAGTGRRSGAVCPGRAL